MFIPLAEVIRAADGVVITRVLALQDCLDVRAELVVPGNDVSEQILDRPALLDVLCGESGFIQPGDGFEQAVSRIRQALKEAGLPWGLGLACVVHYELLGSLSFAGIIGRYLHPVAAGVHVTPASGMVFGAVIEKTDAVGVVTPLDQRQIGLA